MAMTAGGGWPACASIARGDAEERDESGRCLYRNAGNVSREFVPKTFIGKMQNKDGEFSEEVRNKFGRRT